MVHSLLPLVVQPPVWPLAARGVPLLVAALACLATISEGLMTGFNFLSGMQASPQVGY